MDQDRNADPYLDEVSALKRQLREAERRYQELFDFAREGFLVTDSEGIIRQANRAASAMLDVDQNGLVGKRLARYVAEEDRDAFLLQLAQVTERDTGGRKARFELCMRPRHREPFHIAVFAAPMYDDGDLLGVRWSLRDVTERVRIQEGQERLLAEAREQRRAAEKTNRLLQALIQTMPVGAVIADAEGKVMATNAVGRNILGGPVDGTVAHPGREYRPYYPDGTLFPPEDMPLMHALEERRTVRSVEILIQREDAEERAILASAAPVLNRSGEIVSGITVFRDITDRKRAEEALRESERRFRTVADFTYDWEYWLGPDGEYVYVSPSCERITGYPAQAFMNNPELLLEIAHPDDRSAVEAHFAEEAEGSDVRFFDFRITTADGRERWLNHACQPVHAADGEWLGWRGSNRDVTDQKRAEAERERLLGEVQELVTHLERERAKLQAIIENAPEGIIVADDKGRITLTNSAADRLYARPVPRGEGYESQGELCLCRPDGTAIPPRDLPLTRAALDGETHRGEELAIIWPSGERRDLLVDTAPILSGDGEISGAIGVFRDITERKQVEKTLRQYAEQLRVLHEIDAAILAAGSAREIAEASLRGLRKLVRCSLSSVELFDLEAGRTLILASSAPSEGPGREGQWVPLEWQEPVDKLEAGHPFVVEDVSSLPATPLVEALRDEGICSIASVPLHVKGRLMGCLSLGRREKGGFAPEELEVMRDVADQVAIGTRQAELYEQVQRHAQGLEQLVAKRTAELQASEARSRAIFEQSALGIALLDEVGQVMASNAALQRMLGQSNEQLMGEVLARFAHPEEEIAEELVTYQRMATGEQDYHRVETRYIDADDEVRWANLVLSLVRDPASEPDFVIAIVEDVTERKQAQAALIQSEKLAMTGRLAASLAHEVNNPLQTVIGCLGLAEESLTEGDGEDLEQYITMAHEELRRAARIVSRLRDLSRPTDVDAGEPSDVNALVERVLALSRKELENRHIEVALELAEGLPQPMLVPDRMQQVFLNLVLNAADAMSEGGQLRVRTKHDRKSEEVVVTFVDEGPGIPPDVLPSIFAPFFSTKAGGLGLGLFVSQNIVQEHGGRIEVETGPGRGATFRVRLPA